MTDPRDPFDLLGVELSASAKELRRAYLRKVKEHPPERDPEGFRRVREAYDAARESSSTWDPERSVVSIPEPPTQIPRPVGEATVSAVEPVEPTPPVSELLDLIARGELEAARCLRRRLLDAHRDAEEDLDAEDRWRWRLAGEVLPLAEDLPPGAAAALLAVGTFDPELPIGAKARLTWFSILHPVRAHRLRQRVDETTALRVVLADGLPRWPGEQYFVHLVLIAVLLALLDLWGLVDLTWLGDWVFSLLP